MKPVGLFEIGWQLNRHLGIRQAAVAQNLANVNTPGYRAVEAQSQPTFTPSNDVREPALAITNSRHFGVQESNFRLDEFRPTENDDGNHSGNTVVLETELVESGEIQKSMQLNTGVMKAFHRMILASTKA